MSNRLAILDAGRLQQAGRPIDVYRHPSTPFAARFLGSPGMSLWRMRLSSADGEARLHGCYGCAWPAPHLGGTADAEVLVGARPERMRLAPEGGAQCRLRCHSATIEPQGETAIVRARHGEDDVVAVAAVEEAQRLTGDVELWIAPEDLHVFGRDSGRRLPARKAGAVDPSTSAEGSGGPAPAEGLGGPAPAEGSDGAAPAERSEIAAAAEALR